MTSFDEVMAKAAATTQAVMAVFPYGASTKPHLEHPTTRGVSIDLPASRVLAVLCQKGDPSVAAAASGAGLLCFKPSDKVSPNSKGKEWDEYVWLTEKLDIKERAPVVLFLAPDGSVLSKLASPSHTDRVVEAITAVPPLLATWIADRKKDRGRTVSFGLTAD